MSRGGPWTLRARLVALVLVLLTTAMVVVGTVTVLALRSSLLDRVDDQLTSAAARTRTNDTGRPGGPERGPRGRGGAPGFLGAPGNSEGTLGAELDDGAVVAAATIEDDGGRRALPAADAAVLAGVRVQPTPVTYALPTLGEYRVLATATDDGTVLVTGLPLAAAQATTRNLTLVLLAVGGTWLVLAGVVGSLVVRRTLRPLRDVAATAAAVARLPLDRGEVALAERVRDDDPRTEVGQVGSAVNAMLGHVAAALEARHASEERVRGFVADASHELRTPLASIRGYAELTRRSRDQVPPDVARALERVESEAGRMTVLVEELLLLARLDQSLPVATDPVDLTQLLVDVLSDAQVAAPGHRWRLELPDEPVVTHGDAQQLHRVMANLLANARTHTPPGTTVTAALTRTPGGAVLDVVDDGPGIAPHVLPSVFERFVRGETSRSRAHGSTGLGLAIVASITAAHGGRATVTSEPGRTRFTVNLPRHPGGLGGSPGAGSAGVLGHVPQAVVDRLGDDALAADPRQHGRREERGGSDLAGAEGPVGR
ncbi:MAG TPA: ATP-binding protein [Actinomycetales bacterium]